MSRDVRRELHLIGERLSDRGDGEFTDAELQVIEEALHDADGRTRRRAVVLLDDPHVEAGSLPIERLKPGLAELIKQGIDAEEEDRKRTAKRAAKVLAKYGLEDATAIADLTHLGESMLDVPDLDLRTGGAALLGPPTIEDEYTPGVQEIEAMADHVAASDALVEETDRLIDLVAPALVALACAPEDLRDRVPPRIEAVDLAPLLTARYGKGRRTTVHFLCSLAESAPEFVQEYVPELTTLLTDSEPAVAEFASAALIGLAEETGKEALQPALTAVPVALDGNDDHVRRAVLGVTQALAEADPATVDRLPVDRIESVGRELDPASEGQERFWIVRTLGAHAAAEGTASEAESAVEIAFETMAVAPATTTLRSLTALQRGLRDAVAASPANAATAVPADADWPRSADLGPELPIVQMSNAVEDVDLASLAEASDEDGTIDLDTDLLTYWVATYAVREACRDDPTAADAIAAVATDEDQPTARRRLLAGALGAMLVLDQPDDSVLDRIRSVGAALDGAEDDSLERIGQSIRVHES